MQVSAVTKLYVQTLKRYTEQEDFYPGCTDMVRHWQRLGFIAKIQPGPNALPIFIETERNLPVDSSDFV